MRYSEVSLYFCCIFPSVSEKKDSKYLYRISSFYGKRIGTVKDDWRLNHSKTKWIFVNWRACKENVYTLLTNTMRKISRFVGKNLISLCNLLGGAMVRISQKLDIVVFQSWNPDVVAFCLLKKWLGIITMSWINCLCFSMSWCLSPRVSMSRLFGLGISMLWFFGLGISMSCYMCLHGRVFVLMQIVLIILLKNILLIQIYATATLIIHA